MNIQRQCPNGWKCGEDCLHFTRGCTTDHPYIATALEMAAEASEMATHNEAVESVEIIKGKPARAYTDMDRFDSWRVLGLHHVEPLPLDGPSSPGGGSKSNVKKSKKGNKPTVYVWGQM